MGQLTLESLVGFNAADPDVMAKGLPFEELAVLRREAPIWWNATLPDSDGYPDNGFWLVTRNRDIREVSSKPDIYSVEINTAIPRMPPGSGPAEIEGARLAILNMDPPEHTRLRRIVSRGFTPRAIQTIKDSLEERARRIVTAAVATGSGDFVKQVAAELPLQAIAQMIGIPEEDRPRIFDWSNQVVGGEDPEYISNPMNASAEILAYAMELGSERVAEPRDDIVSRLVAAEDDGNLTPEEFGLFVIVLAVAGSETTRNALTHGMMAFFDNPEQWSMYKAERPATAADELIRWASPITMFQRTATRDTILSGTEIKKGERVGLSYLSANFDPEVFDRPELFDITRDPNPHVSFGGGGPHFCLGANLARVEINLMLNAIADIAPDISLAGPARRLRAAWMNSIKELPVRYC